MASTVDAVGGRRLLSSEMSQGMATAIRRARRVVLALGAGAAGSLLVSAQPARAQAVQPVSDERTRTYWTFVRRETVVRRRPASHSRPLGALRRVTAQGLPEVVVVLARADGGRWSRVRYPGLGDRRGWVRSRALGEANLVVTRLLVDRAAMRVTLYRRGRRVFSARAGVGAPGSPTPAGRYYVRERLVLANRQGLYGPRAFGLSAYSPYRTDWPGGGQVGVHGTNQPQLIPGRVSNGCVRLRNRAILALRLPLGTPVVIR